MALTPEEVVNQKFTITKFRDGYDLDQVDDFLDTIVEQLRQDEQEKAELQSELDRANARVEELTAELENARRQLAEGGRSEGADEAAAAESSPSVAEQTIVVEAQPAQPAAAQQQQGNPDATAMKSSAMRQLALELHDKYIHEGEEQRDKLIQNAEATAAQLVEEAQKQRSDELRRLEGERKDYAGRIQELREFESEYRSTLSSYIQAQLRELEGSPEPKGAPKILD